MCTTINWRVDPLKLQKHTQNYNEPKWHSPMIGQYFCRHSLNNSTIRSAFFEFLFILSWHDSVWPHNRYCWDTFASGLDLKAREVAGDLVAHVANHRKYCGNRAIGGPVDLRDTVGSWEKLNGKRCHSVIIIIYRKPFAFFVIGQCNGMWVSECVACVVCTLTI